MSSFEINESALDFQKISIKLTEDEMFLLGYVTGCEAVITSFVDNNTNGELDEETLESTVHDIFGIDEREEVWNKGIELFQSNARPYGEIIKII